MLYGCYHHNIFPVYAWLCCCCVKAVTVVSVCAYTHVHGHACTHTLECDAYHFKTLHEKRLYRKLMQILNNPTHPMRHYFDSRCSNRSGRFLLPRTIQTGIKPCFYPRLCQFLVKIIPVIKLSVRVRQDVCF